MTTASICLSNLKSLLESGEIAVHTHPGTNATGYAR